MLQNSFKEITIYDTIIIGGGVAGILAYHEMLKLGFNPLVIEASSFLGGKLNLYLNKVITNIPGIPSITARDYLKLISKGVNYHTDEVVININGDKVITNQHVYVTKHIIVCKGDGLIQPTKILYNSHQVDYYLQDLYKYRNKKVAVLGGSMSAIESVAVLSKIAKQVTLIHRRNDFRVPIDHLYQLSNVKIVKNVTITNYLENGKIIEIYYTNNEDKLTAVSSVDAILVCYGFEKNYNLEIVDQSQVYYAGDVLRLPAEVKTIAKIILDIGNIIKNINNNYN